MDPYEKAVETMERMIARLEKFHANLWGDKAKFHKCNAVGASNMAQNPELAWVAPYHGDHEFEGYQVRRVQVDQLDNFYFWRA